MLVVKDFFIFFCAEGGEKVPRGLVAYNPAGILQPGM